MIKMKVVYTETGFLVKKVECSRNLKNEQCRVYSDSDSFVSRIVLNQVEIVENIKIH